MEEDVAVHVPLLGPSLLAAVGWSFAPAAALGIPPPHLPNLTPHPRTLEVPAKPTHGPSRDAGQQGIPIRCGSGMQARGGGEVSRGGRVGADPVLQSRSLLCPPPLLIWKSGA